MRIKKAAIFGVGAVAALVHLAERVAWAQGTAGDTASTAAQAAARGARPQFGDPYGFVSTLIFGFLGIIIACAGFKIFDLFIKHDLESEVCEKNNTAAAILGGAVIIGVSLIVAATILS